MPSNMVGAADGGEDAKPSDDDNAVKAPEDEKEDEETKFVEWDPTGRFGRVRGTGPLLPPNPRFARCQDAGH